MLNDDDEPALDISKKATLASGAVLKLILDPQRPPVAGVRSRWSRPESSAPSPKSSFDLPGYTAASTY